MIVENATRLNVVKEYYFSKKLKEIELMKADGHDVINLGIGSPDLAPSKEVIEELNKVSQNENVHGYQSYRGANELREAYADFYKTIYNVKLNPESEVMPLMGSKEGIFHISMAFLNPGDGVLIPNPGYPTYKSVSELVGANVISYNLKEENGWYPDFEELEKQDLSTVKLMWVNYPHMPSGTPASVQVFKKLIAFAKKHRILICHDNPYSLVLNDNPVSMLGIEGAKEVVLELNSLSKSHNLAGWRLGMIAGSSDILQKVLTVLSNIQSGMFLPLQRAATVALRQGKEWYSELNTEYKERQILVKEILDILNCKYSDTQNGLFVWAKTPAGTGSMDLSDEILRTAKVFITPGDIFGTNGKGYIRLSLCVSQERLREVKERLLDLK